MPVVIFITAFDRHALRAFEVSAVDYLLKPFDDERFARALARAKERVRLGEAQALTERLLTLLARRGEPVRAPPPGVPPPADRIAVKDGARVALIPIADIDWIEAQDYYVGIHARGREHLLREPLADLEARLDPRRFVRIHRSVLVNVERIQELQPLTHGESIVVLHDGTRLRLSRSRRKPLLAAMGLLRP